MKVVKECEEFRYFQLLIENLSEVRNSIQYNLGRKKVSSKFKSRLESVTQNIETWGSTKGFGCNPEACVRNCIQSAHKRIF